MAEVELSPPHYRRLLALLERRADLLTPVQRENLLDRAGLYPFRTRLEFNAPIRDFAPQLVRVLQQAGTLPETGKPALVSLLEELCDLVAGHQEERDFIEDLLGPYRKVGDPSRRLKIFVSYRRQDWGVTHRLADELRERLEAEVFVDVQGVDQTDFEHSILAHLQASDAVLLVVTERTFSDRLQNPKDWLRLELGETLRLGKPIVLVGMDNHLPPPPGELPQALRPLTEKQSIAFYPDYWDAAVQRLVAFLTKVTTATTSQIAPTVNTTAPPPAPSNAATLGAALEAFNAGDFERAIFLFQTLRESSFSSPFVDVNALLATALEQRASAERQKALEEAYALVVQLAQGTRTQAQARSAWARFREQYPDAPDPKGTAEHFASPEPPAEPAAPTKTVSRRETQPPAKPAAAGSMQPPATPVSSIQPQPTILPPGTGLRPDGTPDIVWVKLPGGTFPIGGDAEAWDPLPVRQVQLPTFWMAKYPVTNAQWQPFLDDPAGYENPRWWEGLAEGKQQPAPPQWSEPTRPRETVNWYEAMAFCRWLSHRVGYEVRLPTEEGWERTARGAEGRVYPWGGESVEGRANVIEWGGVFIGATGIGQTTPVDKYPQGATPECGLDLAGNVSEWTCTSEETDQSNTTSVSPQILRGGSWNLDSQNARAASRTGVSPSVRCDDTGFRVVTLTPAFDALTSATLDAWPLTGRWGRVPRS